MRLNRYRRVTYLHDECDRRDIENKHSTDIGEKVTVRMNAYTVARRSKRCNVGRVLVRNMNPIIQTRGVYRGGGGG